jgi:DNA repair protein RecO (recombination protein O)
MRIDPAPDRLADPHAPFVAGGKPPARRRGGIERVQDESIYVLHSYPWKETSLLLDVFSRRHGRLALVAKGAKRPTSALRAVLLGFQPCQASWSGRGEVRTLTRAEWVGGHAPLCGLPLLCGFYFNELLVRLLAREDAHEGLFDAYHHAVVALAQRPHALPAELEPVLRQFEFALLRELGHLPQLHVEAATSQPVRPGALYRVDPEHGVAPSSAADPAAVRGEVLLALRDGLPVQPDPALARAAKALMRSLLHYHLSGQTLRTRQLLIDLHKL